VFPQPLYSLPLLTTPRSRKSPLSRLAPQRRSDRPVGHALSPVGRNKQLPPGCIKSSDPSPCWRPRSARFFPPSVEVVGQNVQPLAIAKRMQVAGRRRRPNRSSAPGAKIRSSPSTPAGYLHTFRDGERLDILAYNFSNTENSGLHRGRQHGDGSRRLDATRAAIAYSARPDLVHGQQAYQIAFAGEAVTEDFYGSVVSLTVEESTAAAGTLDLRLATPTWQRWVLGAVDDSRLDLFTAISVKAGFTGGQGLAGALGGAHRWQRWIGARVRRFTLPR